MDFFIALTGQGSFASDAWSSGWKALAPKVNATAHKPRKTPACIATTQVKR
jgi:hypothetical protein